MTHKAPYWFSSRMFITVMSFFVLFCQYMLRFNMSVGILCMVNHTAISSNASDRSSIKDNANRTAILADNKTLTLEQNYEELGRRYAKNHSENKKSFSECGADMHSLSEEKRKNGPFAWTKQEQGLILGSYYWGYVLCVVPCGWLASKYGSVRILGISTAFRSVLCLLIPVISPLSPIGVILVRILTGCVTGFYLPCVQNLLGRWVPQGELAGLTSFAFSSYAAGNLLSFTSSSYLCEYGFVDGWQSIFYLNGSVCLVFSLAWMMLVSDSPFIHPRISQAEKQYIMDEIKRGHRLNKPQRVPWRQILTSLPVLAIVTSTVSLEFYVSIFSLFIPTYFSDVLHFQITSTGLLSALMCIIYFLMQIAGGVLSDVMMRRTSISVGTTRKLVIGFAKISCAVSIIVLGFMTCEKATLAVALLMVISASIGLMSLGFTVNPMDIAAHFSGLVLSLAQFIAQAVSLAAPALTTAVITSDSSRASWQIVFSVCGSIVAFAFIVYVCCASGEVQPWATSPIGESKEVRKSLGGIHKDLAVITGSEISISIRPSD